MLKPRTDVLKRVARFASSGEHRVASVVTRDGLYLVETSVAGEGKVWHSLGVARELAEKMAQDFVNSDFI